MLHLLPDSYIREMQKEYRKRSAVAACNLLAFCLFVFIVGSIPAYVIIAAQKGELERQSNALTFRISDEDKEVAEVFESAVERGVGVINNTSTLNSSKVEYLLSLPRQGISLQGIVIEKQEGAEQAMLEGTANTRADLSAYIREIDGGGVYKVDDVPASTFTKDKDIVFTLVLKKIKAKRSTQ